MKTTLCWQCSHPYPETYGHCPKCGSTNANVDHKAAQNEINVQNMRYDIKELLAVGAMMDAVIEGAQTDFVRVPYGASREDVAQINEWHAMAEEARASFADARRLIRNNYDPSR